MSEQIGPLSQECKCVNIWDQTQNLAAGSPSCIQCKQFLIHVLPFSALSMASLSFSVPLPSSVSFALLNGYQLCCRFLFITSQVHGSVHKTEHFHERNLFI